VAPSGDNPSLHKAGTDDGKGDGKGDDEGEDWSKNRHLWKALGSGLHEDHNGNAIMTTVEPGRGVPGAHRRVRA